MLSESPSPSTIFVTVTRRQPWLCLALLMAATPAPARAAADGQAPRPRYETRGLAVGAEGGHYGGGYGVTWAFYQPLPVARLTVGLGVGWGFTGGEPPGFAFGVNTFACYGRMHRALLVLGYATQERSSLTLHGTPAAERSYWGPEASAGYELLAGRGPVLRMLVGAAYLPWQATPDGDRLRATLTLGLAWKFN
jgi:hypothetical protein